MCNSTSRTRAAKRDKIAADAELIAAKLEARKPVKITINPAWKAGIAIVCAVVATGWVEGLSALPL